MISKAASFHTLKEYTRSLCDTGTMVHTCELYVLYVRVSHRVTV